MTRVVVTLVALAAAAPALAVDLNAIDRSLVKEPAYQTRLPKYCLLVFAPEAKARVWLVLDGDDLYVDRDGTGDVTAPGKRVAGKRSGRWLEFHAGPVDTQGKPRDLRLRVRGFDPADGKCTGMILTLDGKRRQYVGFDEANPFRFAQRPAQAPIIHLEGPLSMQLYGEPVTLIAGREADLNISIGTPGIGRGSFCAIQCCTVLDCKVSPVAEILFPARVPGRTPPTSRVPIADD
jgi:hypothetical protein